MSKTLVNFWNRLLWRIQWHCNVVNMPIAPIQWGPVREQATPSSNFIETLSEKDKTALKAIEKEIQILSRLLTHFPSAISDRSWKILLECRSTSERFHHIKFCSKVEKLRLENKKKSVRTQPKPVYDKIDTVWNVSSRKFLNWERVWTWNRTVIAHRLNVGPKIAIDCRYFPDLSPRAADLTAVQLQYLISENRDRRYPMQLYFVNWTLDRCKYNYIQDKHLSILSSSKNAGPVVIPENYTEISDPENVIYLSPHAEEEIESIDEDTVYVLGGIVDRVVEKGIPHNASAVFAQQDGIVAKKLPIDKYISWKSGSKFLTLTAVVNIIHHVYHSNNDWEGAFKRYIPIRNVRSADEKNKAVKLYHKRKIAFNTKIIETVKRELRSQNF